VHPRPAEAICDGPQSLVAGDFAGYVGRIAAAAAVAGRQLSVDVPSADPVAA
jgi:3-deoxy-D-arabino-heptulosonate 7-phosphate (DAHP) synthase